MQCEHRFSQLPIEVEFFYELFTFFFLSIKILPQQKLFPWVHTTKKERTKKKEKKNIKTLLQTFYNNK